jgi:hypothetical protein
MVNIYFSRHQTEVKLYKTSKDKHPFLIINNYDSMRRFMSDVSSAAGPELVTYPCFSITKKRFGIRNDIGTVTAWIEKDSSVWFQTWSQYWFKGVEIQIRHFDTASCLYGGETLPGQIGNCEVQTVTVDSVKGDWMHVHFAPYQMYEPGCKEFVLPEGYWFLWRKNEQFFAAYFIED